MVVNDLESSFQKIPCIFFFNFLWHVYTTCLLSHCVNRKIILSPNNKPILSSLCSTYLLYDQAEPKTFSDHPIHLS